MNKRGFAAKPLFFQRLFGKRQKGFFCFLIVLAAIAIEAGLLENAAEAERVIGRGRAIAFEAESAALARTLIEDSLDSAIKSELKEGIALNLEPGEIRERANRKILLLFQRIEEAFNEGISARFYSEQGKIDETFLNKNSKVNVIRVRGKSVKAEYSYTGGLLKNNRVFAEISGKNARMLFTIPIGYTVSETALEMETIAGGN